MKKDKKQQFIIDDGPIDYKCLYKHLQKEIINYFKKEKLNNKIALKLENTLYDEINKLHKLGFKIKLTDYEHQEIKSNCSQIIPDSVYIMFYKLEADEEIEKDKDRE